MERSVELVVALLGILKAGGAYVPLSSDYSLELKDRLMVDAQVRVVMTSERSRTQLQPGRTLLVSIDGEAAAIARQSHVNLTPLASASNLALVSYSPLAGTGAGPGVAVTHGALSGMLTNGNYGSLGAGNVFLQLSTISSNAALLEVWGPLLHGGAVALAPAGMTFIEQLRGGMRMYPVTTLLLTSRQFRVVAEQALDALAGLRYLLVEGDAFLSIQAARARRVLEDLALIHVYGPPEATLYATAYRIEGDISISTVPIGNPVANIETCALDRWLEPVPVSVGGELYVGGEALARCYWGQPALTAERFRPNPFGSPGSGLHRTGDRARYLAGGEVEFLGRIDDQVRVRGFRIQTAEVEAALAKHAQVEDVAVVQQDSAEGRVLVAYVVRRSGAWSRDNWMVYLSSTLPQYLVPNAVVALDTIPLTVDGRLDHQALATSAERHKQEGRKNLPPTQTEEVVLNVWRQVLGVDDVEPDVTLQDAGNSLLVALLCQQLRERFPAAQLDPFDLFDHTCASLAVMIDARLEHPDRSERTPKLSSE